MSMTATARLETAQAKRYLGQFCKHFAHRVPVVLAETNESGTVTFDMGTCSLSADTAALHLTAQAGTAEQLAILQSVIDRHLVRFAFREDIVLNWQPAD